MTKKKPELTVVDGKADGAPDPVTFRVPASDSKGHSARVWFRVQPSMASQSQKILDSKLFPYRTKGDIFRHALYRHLKWLTTQEGIPSVMGQIDAILEVIREDEEFQDFENTINKINERLSYYMSQGETGRARRILLKIHNNVSKMPDDYWRKKFTKELTSRYGYILDKAPGADLTDHED